MGKWLYVNLVLVAASIICMFLLYTYRYAPGIHVYLLSTIFWLMLGGLGYYIFVYRIKLSEQKGEKNHQKISLSAKSSRPNVRPKAALNKERPQVVLKKQKNNKHGK
ncbi:hypothetical protein PZB74_14535 [Porifericola rhodea]|uniref:hypothetical protein n=1 Tax=Porifericola rhodea TaxID=930972 RepID=UPI002665AACA|nr:hypothetical protein [Porifericola rhodea]WKN30180.1 hypothetical protein PZB74_14535 [Porifericola rhodea]